MRKRFEASALLTALALTLGCATLVDGPPPPEPGDVVSIEVVDEADVGSARRTIVDPESILQIVRSYAVASSGWEKAKPGLPTYLRFELLSRDGSRRTYWLGSNSDLGIFPCYRLCSGVWIGVAQDGSASGPTLIKGLADVPQFDLFRALGN